jgi:FtsZ-binding cell division protein ZapB
MGYSSGAPPWVYKQREVALSSSYESQIARLQMRIKELEEENGRLKKQLETARTK